MEWAGSAADVDFRAVGACQLADAILDEALFVLQLAVLLAALLGWCLVREGVAGCI